MKIKKDKNTDTDMSTGKEVEKMGSSFRESSGQVLVRKCFQSRTLILIN